MSCSLAHLYSDLFAFISLHYRVIWTTNIYEHKNKQLNISIVDDTPEDGAEFITTFETVTENDKTVIKSKNKKVTKKENFVVEEVLSDEDIPIVTEDTTDVQIEEVFDTEGKLTIFRIQFLLFRRTFDLIWR